MAAAIAAFPLAIFYLFFTRLLSFYISFYFNLYF